jgi:hypothetical protein
MITPAVAVFGTFFLIGLIGLIKIISTQDGRDFLHRLFKVFF